MDDTITLAALWWAVIASGFYHGVNPGMGWPLAVSSALFERSGAALTRAVAMLAVGHFLAMTAILLPFTLMITLVEFQRAIRIGAGLMVISLGLYLIATRSRHPRILARIKPTQLGLWSFLAAIAHGAGLMLVPIYLGICAADTLEGGHAAADTLMADNARTALAVALAHTAAMSLAGGTLAAGIYYWLGLKFLQKSWFNLDLVWATSLLVVGGIGIASAV